MITQATYSGNPCKRGHDGIRFTRTRNCVECNRIRTREDARRRWRDDPEKIKGAVEKYQASDRCKATGAAYRASEARRLVLKKYNASDSHRESVRRYLGSEKQKATQRRNQSNPKQKIIRSLRDRVRKILRRGKGVRAGSAVRDLGCSIQFFRSYIEERFQHGMNWSNYGEWHLDHIKPLRTFDLTDRLQFLQACNYQNYQPLWAIDNLRKAGKFAEAA